MEIRCRRRRRVRHSRRRRRQEWGRRGSGLGLTRGWADWRQKKEARAALSFRVKLGLLGSLLRWRAHLACHLSKNDKNVGGLLFAMANM